MTFSILKCESFLHTYIPTTGSEPKLRKGLLSDHRGGKNDRKFLTPTVFQALIVPGTQIQTQDLSEDTYIIEK